MLVRLFLLLILSIPELWAQVPPIAEPDVLHYDVKLEPDLVAQTIQGEVNIRFQTEENAREVIFHCGALKVDTVKGTAVSTFRQEDSRLVIVLSEEAGTAHEVNITYHGKPRRGVVFSPEKRQMYTVYFTHEWMVCHDQVYDRASINMDIIVPADLNNIASGTLMGKKEIQDNKAMYSWKQDVATPPYTYGFALGVFHKYEEDQDGVALQYYSARHGTDELSDIFKASADMLEFFEEKSGMPYFQKSYTQIMMGEHYQEMSGFAVLKETYGEIILEDSTEVNLIAHEMAHQWWGNMITCESLGHFWLNEAFATYMSAAYNEQGFGRDKYMENINAYKVVYQKVKAKGADKPLVFEGWTNPTADDRSLVYFKGAYVLHCLREEVGDEAFWKGIRFYSRKYYGKSVLTQDFQQAMEASSQKDLSEFFKRWVY